ncbi:hypothetical protein AB0M28_38830 [Streptomyces sp. NPDC051940]|uniref:hypothetical protein n=1 Tax=Streptomyces sp. NPDC051940 TaxID=3155675 RepID=UPI0034313AF8
MSLAPRAVVVHRSTEYQELLARHGTHGQAAHFLATRDQDIAEVVESHRLATRALAVATARIPFDWRRAKVERAGLDRFLFAPEDVVLVVGQDGLVANAAKYLSGQPVIGVNPDPRRNPGVLVRHTAPDASWLLVEALADARGAEHLTMVEAVADDSQRLLALNEVFLGPPSHQTARYTLAEEGGPPETQASSGVLVGTGAGATGWLRSVWQERHSALPLPARGDRTLIWFVREAWPSPATGTSRVSGVLTADRRLTLTVRTERLTAFGDGIESDALDLTWGQTVRIGVAETALRLM